MPAPGYTAPTCRPNLARQHQAVTAFMTGARQGDLDALVAVLQPDVLLRADIGQQRGASVSIRGVATVARPASRGAAGKGCSGGQTVLQRDDREAGQQHEPGAGRFHAAQRPVGGPALAATTGGAGTWPQSRPVTQRTFAVTALSAVTFSRRCGS